MTVPGAFPASMAKRLLAYVIDASAAVILGGAFVLAGAAQMVDAVRVGTTPTATTGGPLVAVGYALVLAFGIFQWWYQGRRGYTVGKRAVGIRTLSAVTGQPIGMGRVLVRYLVVAAGALVLGVGQLVVYLSPFFDSSGRRQGWHDKAAGSMVFDVASGVDPARTGGHVTEQAALRRMEQLLHPPVDAAVPVAAVPVAEVLVAEGSPVPGAAPSHDAHAGPVPPPPPAPAPEPDPTPALAPQPDPTHRPDPTPSTEPVVNVPGAAPRPAGPPVVPAPPPSSPGIISSVPGVSPFVRAPLDDDVDSTRLTGTSRLPAFGGDGHPDVPAQYTSPKAALRLWDDRRVTITGVMLVGRNPAPRAGEPAPEQLLTVPDAGRSVSKTHLAVGVDLAGVWVRDRHSTNGTVVTLPDGQQIICAGDQEVRVPPGSSVAFGDCWFAVG